MKKNLLTLLIMVAANLGAFAQNVNIPDASFKAYLVGNSSINTNADSEIQVSEAAAFTGTINCQSLNISDLTGIEEFVNLSMLNCEINNLTNLNLSQNVALTELYLNNNNLSSLDLTQNTALTLLRCGYNSLTNLDLSHNVNLTNLQCYSNSLSYLDLSGNLVLEYLYCQNNALTSLNVANGNNSNFTSFRATGNSNLTCIQVDDVNYSSTNWTDIDPTSSFSLDCNYAVYIPDASFKAYLVGNSAINTNSDSEIQVSEAAAFTGTINATGVSLTDLTGIEAFTALTRLYCQDNSALTSIDVSSNTALLVLRCDNNALTTLDVSNNTALTQLLCSNNSLTTLDVSNNTQLTFLKCSSNSLTAIDVSNNTALTSFDCGYNSITNLDVSNNTDLELLGCASNSLTALDVSNNTALIDFYCHDNALTELNVSNNTALSLFICHNNALTALDVTNNTSLTQLRCDNNPLTILNAANGNNTSISFFYTLNTPNLTCIQVDDVTYSTTNWTDIDAASSFSVDCNYPANVYIPDANFKAYLVGNSAINTNSDSEIQVSEAVAFTGQIFCQNLNISDLTGIEEFVNLTGLICIGSNLTSLDVTQNTALTSLNCQDNNLTSLDVSQNTLLTGLNCSKNNITSLNLDQNQDLNLLLCHENNLTVLDVSQLTELVVFNCFQNSIETLDFSQNTGINQNTTLEIPQIDCRENNLTVLKMKNISTTSLQGQFFKATSNPNLTCIEVDDVTAAETSWTNIDATASYSTACGATGLSETELSQLITVYPNPAKSEIFIESDFATILSVSIVDLLGSVLLTDLDSTSSIDVSELPSGIYTLQLTTNNGVASKTLVIE